LGAVLMIFGVLTLAITTMASCDPDGPGPAVFALEVAASVCLGWLGYKVQRRRVGDSLAEMPLPTPVPSARVIRPEDVLGPWRFYIDAVTSTVTVDLQADGRYTQVIVGNCGKPIDCPGGAWTLEGPHLELTSYRSAVRKVTKRVRWFFGDWQKDLVLFAKDDPQGKTMLLGLRYTAVATRAAR
jgi:hypothetical protein